MKVLIVGAGGHGQVVCDGLRVPATLTRDPKSLVKGRGSRIELVGFLDDDPALQGQEVDRVPVLGKVEERGKFQYDALIVAIGENWIRKAIFEKLSSEGETFVNVLHPGAIVSPTISLGRNVMICAGAVVNPRARIEDDVILNTSCSVDHHSVIGNHAHIAPGAHLGGDVSVGKGALVGIGASVLPGVTIGEEAVVGAGAVVVKNVPAHATVVGVPARRVTRRA